MQQRVRFTLDLEPQFQRKLKAVAAMRGMSMREYCLRAIERELETEMNGKNEDADKSLLRVLALRDALFKGRRVESDSTELLREGRERRIAEE